MVDEWMEEERRMEEREEAEEDRATAWMDEELQQPAEYYDPKGGPKERPRRPRRQMDEKSLQWSASEDVGDESDRRADLGESLHPRMLRRKRPQDIRGFWERRDLGKVDVDGLDADGELRGLSLEELEARVSRRKTEVRKPLPPRAPRGSEVAAPKRARPAARAPQRGSRGWSAVDAVDEDMDLDVPEGLEDIEVPQSGAKENAFRSSWGKYPPQPDAARTDSEEKEDAAANLGTFTGRSDAVVAKSRKKTLSGWLMPVPDLSDEKKKKKRAKQIEDEDEDEEILMDEEAPREAKFAKIYRAMMRKMLPLPWDKVEGDVTWTDPSGKSWQELGFTTREAKEMLRILHRRKVYSPNVLQARAAPDLYNLKDALLSSMTGSGKTFAFLVPLLTKHILPLSKLDLQRKPPRKKLRPGLTPKQWARPRMLVLAPSRELAAQTSRIIRNLLEPFPTLNVTTLIGGANHKRQDEHLKERNPMIVVATPGRLLDHATEGRLDLRNLRAVVIDEVDMLLNVSRSDQVDLLLEKLTAASTAQKVLVSATSATDRVSTDLASRFLRGNWSWLGPKSSVELPSRVLHLVKVAPDMTKKLSFIAKLINSHPLPQGVLVFCNNADRARKVSEQCRRWGITSAVISGNRTTNNRAKAIQWMNKGEIEVLVATDIATRGMDFNQVSHVVNFELPGDAVTYAHRAGRCGRMGRNGIVISLASGGVNNLRLNRISEELGFELFEGHVSHTQLGVLESYVARSRVGAVGQLGVPSQLAGQQRRQEQEQQEEEPDQLEQPEEEPDELEQPDRVEAAPGVW